MKYLITLVKILASAGILAYLVYDATRGKDGGNVFAAMVQQPKQWDMLAVAALLSFVAVALTMVRWCYLVRAVGIPFRMKDAFRIGFLGYLFNLAPMGIVGGDLLKAVILARENPGKRAKAVASVVIDRVVGLYVLFLLGTAGIVLTGFYWSVPLPEVRLICQVVVGLTLVGAVGIGVLLATPVIDSRWVTAVTRLPRVGRAVGSLLEAVRVYRNNVPVLAASTLVSLVVQSLFTISIYFVARGLPGDVLPLSTQFVVFPVSSVANVVPFPAGPFEAVLEFMYTHVSTILSVPKGQGLVVALVYRLISVGIAAVGFCYYLGSRREMAAVMQEVAEEEQGGKSPWTETAREQAGLRGDEPEPSGSRAGN